MKYICLPKDSYEFQGYTLTSLREEDIFLVKEWRNDQIHALRQKKPLSDDEQARYYRRVVLPSMNDCEPDNILFSYLKNGKCIGYGGLTHIDWQCRRAEISFLLETKRTLVPTLYQQDFTVFLKLIKQIAFTELDLNRLFTETYDLRPLHLEAIEENGFRLEGRLREHVRIEGKYVDSLLHGYLHKDYNEETADV